MAKLSDTVMVFGTFDLLHQGHVNFLQQAKALGSKLVVSIARDINVKKIKGERPWNSEKKRLQNIKKLGIADLVILGDKTGYIRHIAKVAPDTIALGYDQRAYTKTLHRDLRAAGLATKIVRLKGHRPRVFKSSKLKVKMLKSE